MKPPNSRERQIMQHLRGAGWVKATGLPDSPRIMTNLIRRGWIECRQTENGQAYRVRRTEIDRWFVTIVERPKSQRVVPGRQTAPVRQSKTFSTEAEAKQYAKEMLTEGRKIIAGTLLSAHQPVRRIISSSQVDRWIAGSDFDMTG